MDQKTIFDAQLDKFINPSKKVAILSALPHFLLEYYGEKLYKKIFEIN